jgi:hypothetical protein
MKLDKQKILNEAPEGATHWGKLSSIYYKFGKSIAMCFGGLGWVNHTRIDNMNMHNIISLEDLRAMPDALFNAAVNFESYVECLRCTPPEKRPFIMSQWKDARRTLKLDPEPAENWTEEDERRMEPVEQNGNTGDHYEYHACSYEGFLSDPMTLDDADSLAKRWASERPGKSITVVQVVAEYKSSVVVERVR